MKISVNFGLIISYSFFARKSPIQPPINPPRAPPRAIPIAVPNPGTILPKNPKTAAPKGTPIQAPSPAPRAPTRALSKGSPSAKSTPSPIIDPMKGIFFINPLAIFKLFAPDPKSLNAPFLNPGDAALYNPAFAPRISFGIAFCFFKSFSGVNLRLAALFPNFCSYLALTLESYVNALRLAKLEASSAFSTILETNDFSFILSPAFVRPSHPFLL